MKDNECHLEIVLGTIYWWDWPLGTFSQVCPTYGLWAPCDWGQPTQNPQTHFNHERCLGNAVGNTTTHFEDDSVVSRWPRLDRPIVIWMPNAPCGLMPLNTLSQLVVLFGMVFRLLGGGGSGRGRAWRLYCPEAVSSRSTPLPGFGHKWPASLLQLPSCLPLLSSQPQGAVSLWNSKPKQTPSHPSFFCWAILITVLKKKLRPCLHMTHSRAERQFL